MSSLGESAEKTLLQRMLRWNSFLNDILLIPMFTAIILETSVSKDHAWFGMISGSNLWFCLTFFSEWLLGLLTAEDKKGYLKSPARFIDLISSLPFGNIFQGLRIFRLTRVIRLLRVVVRARRYKGKGEKLLRALSIVGATIFAGALALQIVEPSAVDRSFPSAIWWSLVTVSTVGYGDIAPSSMAGRAVASTLILFGMGVAGYLAGFMASVLAEPDEEDLIDVCYRLDDKLSRIAAHLEIDVSDLQRPVLDDLDR